MPRRLQLNDERRAADAEAEGRRDGSVMGRGYLSYSRPTGLTPLLRFVATNPKQLYNKRDDTLVDPLRFYFFR